MKRLVIEEIERLPSYIPGKPIEEVQREYGISEVIKLASNENPLGPSPRAISAINSALSNLNRYPDSAGYHLKEKLADKFKVKMKNIVLGNGSDEVLQMVIRTFILAGDEVIMAMPTFAFYEIVVGAARGKVIQVPLKNFAYNLDLMKEKITSKTKVIILTNPHSPTGTIIEKREFERFLDALPEDVVLTLDEAYAEFVQNKNFPDSLRYLDSGKRIIILRTFSKIYGLAGLRIGYGIGNPELISYLEKIREPFNTSSLAQVGALAALDDEEHLERTKRNNREGLQYLYTELDRLGLEYLPTEANFFLVNVRRNCQSVFHSLLKSGIIVRPMDSYGLNEFIRISAGLPEENRRFIQALEKVIKNSG
jgi:histidinol-phosphate aminotransferase